jgi:hypothetical protein
VHGAHNKLATAEDKSEHELEALHQAYCKRADETAAALERHRARKKRARAT